MANDVKLSKELLVVYNGQSIAKATSFTFEINKSEIDVSNLDSNSWNQKLVDNKDWSMSFDGLVTRNTITGTSYSEMTGTTHIDFDNLLQEVKTNDDAVTVALVSRITGDKYETGLGFITALSATGSVGAAMTYSGTISGTGALTQKTAT